MCSILTSNLPNCFLCHQKTSLLEGVRGVDMSVTEANVGELQRLTDQVNDRGGRIGGRINVGVVPALLQLMNVCPNAC
jgi:hypothetical protein